MLKFLKQLLEPRKALIIAEYDTKVLSRAEAQEKADEMERKSGHPVIIVPQDRMIVRCVLS